MEIKMRYWFLVTSGIIQLLQSKRCSHHFLCCQHITVCMYVCCPFTWQRLRSCYISLALSPTCCVSHLSVAVTKPLTGEGRKDLDSQFQRVQSMVYGLCGCRPSVRWALYQQGLAEASREGKARGRSWGQDVPSEACSPWLLSTSCSRSHLLSALR